MTRNEFLRLLEGQLELPAETLHEGQNLQDVDGWDSMAAVLFIALADEHAGVAVSGNQIARTKTVGGLLSLLGESVTA